MKTKKKTVYELECEFTKAQKLTLQQLLSNAYEKLPHIIDRKFEKRDTIYWGIDFDNNKQYFAFQFCMCSNGESSNIFTNRNANKTKAKLETLSPPDNSDFSDGDIICLVKKNKLYVCCSQIRWQQIYYYLNELFIKVGLYSAKTIFFKIVQKANNDLLKQIYREKLQEITVELPTTYDVFEDVKKEHTSTIIKMAITAFKQYKSKKELQKEPAPIGKLILKSGRNSIKWMNNEMKEITDSSLKYRILTKKGTIITPDNIKITYSINAVPNGKSVNFDDVTAKINAMLM